MVLGIIDAFNSPFWLLLPVGVLLAVLFYNFDSQAGGDADATETR